MSGTFCGGITVFELGLGIDGMDGDTEATGPGGRDIGPVAVKLSEPGRMIGLGSCMLGLVLGSDFLVSANDL